MTNKIILKVQAGLGNQLFQYASARMLAHMFNSTLELDLDFYNKQEFKGIYRLNDFKIIGKIAIPSEVDQLKNDPIRNKLFYMLRVLNVQCKYNKKTHFIERPLSDNIKELKRLQPPVYLEGWFNNSNFFSPIKTILNKEIDLKNKEFILGSKEFHEIVNDKNSVGIHLRCGDYLKNSYFSNLDYNYYRKAMQLVTSFVLSPNFYIFSDDIPLAKKMFSSTPNCFFVESYSQKQSAYNTVGDVWDFYLMNNCRHLIIANSTFSWWSAWLNETEKKIIVSPQKWYNNKLAQNYIETINFMPKSWYILEN